MANTKITSRVIADDAVTTAAIADDVALGGNPTTTTQSAGNSTTRIATTAFVTTAVSNLVDSAPGALDTLNELAAALGDDASFSTTVTNSIATKLPLAGGTLTGDLILGDNVKIEIGSASGGDLQIYHNGSNSFIDDSGTGNLQIRANAQVKIQKYTGENMFVGIADGAASMYHDNVQRIATTSSGATVIGNLGIGTAAPTRSLSISGTGSQYINVVSANDSGAGILLGDTDAEIRGAILYDNGAETLQLRSGGNTTAITIDSSQRVLIGSSTALSVTGGPRQFQIEGTSGVTASMSIIRHSNSSGGSTISLSKSRATADSGVTVVAANDVLGEIRFTGADGSDHDAVAANIKAEVDGTPGSNDMPGRLTFWTTADGAAAETERMRINNAGSVGIGTTPNSGWSAASTSGRVPIQIGAGSISGRLNDNHTEFSNNCYASGTGNDPQWSGLTRYAKQQIEFDSNGQIIFKNAATVDQSTFDSSPNFTFSNRMVIEADGGVAIGGTSSVYTCEIHGTAIIGAQYNKGAVMPFSDNTYDLGHSSYRWDDIYATNNTIQTSDKNLKDNITESDLGLSFIKELKPVSYKWKDKTRTHYGLIAQDVETVLSDISKPTADFAGFIKMEPEEEAPKHEENPVTETRYGLRYNEFIAPLIKAIQEQQTLIETLQTKVKALEEA